MVGQNGIKAAFLSWYRENYSRFRVRPSVKDKAEGRHTIEFPGMDPHITVILNGDSEWAEIEAWVRYKRNDWDALPGSTFEVMPRLRSSGEYYCERCQEGQRKSFRSLQLLLNDHLFEPFLEWANKNLTPSRWVCLFALRGATWAKAVEEKDMEEMKEKEEADHFVYAFPVMKRKKVAAGHTEKGSRQGLP